MKAALKFRIGIVLVLLILHYVVTVNNAAGKNAISISREGWTYLRKGDTYKAIDRFKSALEKNPDYKNALLGLAGAYYQTEAFEESIKLYNRVLRLQSSSVEAFVGMGLSLTRLGRYRQAIDKFSRAERISESNINAKYGLAYLYYLMGKKTWAKRKLKSILRISPYHYNSILLMADIKGSENRLAEARSLIRKAIDINGEAVAGYTKLGEILLRDYLQNNNKDSLAEAKEALRNALLIQPLDYNANRIMGNVFLIEAVRFSGDTGIKEDLFNETIKYFKNALRVIRNSTILYSLAVSYDLADQRDPALNYFLLSLKRSPYDSILIGRLEDFLVLHDYKIGHPARVMLNKERYNRSLRSMKKNLPDEVLLYLRRALLMNPMHREAREALADYYSVLGYNRFYINEIKSLLRLFPGKKYQDRLSAAIIRRRKRLYHTEGFSSEIPPRDVSRVVVLDFSSEGRITDHPDAGEVIGSMISFAMKQFGRMEPVGIRQRALLVRELINDGGYIDRSLEKIRKKIRSGTLGPIDHVVYGSYIENGNNISIHCKLLEFHSGVVIGTFNISESGKNNLPKLALRVVKKIYSMIPFKGRVLKLKDNAIIVNLGKFDGILPGRKLVIYKYNNPSGKGKALKRRLIFTVKESDTIISLATPQKITDLDEIYASDPVYPLKNRRAKRIE